MYAQVTKLAAVAAMAVGLAVGGGAAAGAPVTLPAWEGLDSPGGGGNARTTVVSLGGDQGGDQDGGARAGRMVGRYYVGFQLPE